MKHLLMTVASILAIATPLAAQNNCATGDIEKYAARASSRSDVNLDRNMLGFAGNFLNDKDSDQSQAKKVVRQLNGIVVHSYEFDEPGQYSPADLQSIRDHYNGASWSHIVSTREQAKGKGPEYSDIWMHLENGKSTGMVILSAEEKEISFVCIDGSLDPSMLSSLSGQFGIPKVDAPAAGASGTKKLVMSDDTEGGKQVKFISLALCAVALTPLTAVASDHDFNAAVASIQASYHVHRQHIPMIGLASFCAHVATGGAIKGIKVAEFDEGSRLPQHADLPALLQSTLGTSWSLVVATRSRGDEHGSGEQDAIYARAHGDRMTLLVASYDRDDFSIVRLDMNGEQLAKWIHDPVRHAGHHHTDKAETN